MDKIREGYHQFRSKVFTSQKKEFERLASTQQRPKALMITCSDSRIDPNLFTTTDPGDLFVIRNAGNIIPPFGSANGGEGSTVEYAVKVLQVKHIILCGHSHCGAMKALLDFNHDPKILDNLPCVADWFDHAEATRMIVKERYPNLKGEDLLTAAVEENVLIQLNNLSTHPVVAAGLAQGTLNLYGWRYEIETGTVYEYDQNTGKFPPMGNDNRTAIPLAIRSSVKHK